MAQRYAAVGKVLILTSKHLLLFLNFPSHCLCSARCLLAWESEFIPLVHGAFYLFDTCLVHQANRFYQSDRPIAIGSCTIYNNWREGLDGYTNAYENTFVNTLKTGVLARYRSRDIAYARGLNDNGDVSDDCAPYPAGYASVHSPLLRLFRTDSHFAIQSHPWSTILQFHHEIWHRFRRYRRLCCWCWTQCCRHDDQHSRSV